LLYFYPIAYRHRPRFQYKLSRPCNKFSIWENDAWPPWTTGPWKPSNKAPMTPHTVYGVVPAEEGSVVCCAFRAWFDYMQSLLGILNTGAFIRNRPLHTNAFTQWRWYGQMRLHAAPLAGTFDIRRHLHTHAVTHTDACTHGLFYNRLLLHTQAPPTHTHRHLRTLLHTDLSTRARTLWHTDSFPHSRFCTPASTHRRLDAHAQADKHTGTFARRCSYTPTLSHRCCCTRAQTSEKTIC